MGAAAARAPRDVVEPASAAGRGDIGLGGARILVVEDNALNRLLLHDILELRGHEVIEAANVVEALPLLDRAHLDLLLLDVHIPGGGGEAWSARCASAPTWPTCRSSR